jgi:hypothetical protein
VRYGFLETKGARFDFALKKLSSQSISDFYDLLIIPAGKPRPELWETSKKCSHGHGNQGMLRNWRSLTRRREKDSFKHREALRAYIELSFF